MAAKTRGRSGAGTSKGPPSAKAMTAGVRVGLLAGPEHFLRLAHTRTLRDALRAEYGEIGEFHFDGTRAEVAAVLDECRSFGLMSGHKLVVVDTAEEFVREDTRPMLQRYADAPAEGATLLLRAARKISGNLVKTIAAAGGYIACDPPDEDLARRWAIKRARQHHRATLGDDTARALIDRLGPDLGRIDSELAKLAVAAGPGGTITTEHLAELGAGSRAFDPWAVQGGMATGDPERALTRVREVLDEVPKDQSYPAMLAAVQLAQKLHQVRLGLDAGMRLEDAARAARLWGAARAPVQAAARSLSPEAARRLYLETFDAQCRVLSGLGTNRRAVEIASLRLSSRLSARPSACR